MTFGQAIHIDKLDVGLPEYVLDHSVLDDDQRGAGGPLRPDGGLALGMHRLQAFGDAGNQRVLENWMWRAGA
jgi:hypothetical protein